jgi:hypothetical protein
MVQEGLVRVNELSHVQPEKEFFPIFFNNE